MTMLDDSMPPLPPLPPLPPEGGDEPAWSPSSQGDDASLEETIKAPLAQKPATSVALYTFDTTTLAVSAAGGAISVMLPPFCAAGAAMSFLLTSIPGGAVAIVAAIITRLWNSPWAAAIAAVANLIAIILIAQSMSIKIDIPSVMKAINGIFKKIMEGQDSNNGGMMQAETKLKIQLLKPPTVGNDTEEYSSGMYGGNGPSGGMGGGMGMGMGGEEEFIITSDFFALLLAFVGGAVSGLSISGSALFAPASLGLGLALLQMQEGRTISWPLAISAVVSSVLGVRGVLWASAVLYPFFVPTGRVTTKKKPAPAPVELTPAEVFRQKVLARLSTGAQRASVPGVTEITVEFAEQVGIQDTYTVFSNGEVASQSVAMSLIRAFGDLEFHVGRRNGQVALFITNKYIVPPTTKASTFLELARGLTSDTIPIGMDIATGELKTLDLESVPHFSNTGTSGSGKSVTIRTAFLTQMQLFPPTELLHVCCDAKAGTFTFTAPHLVINVNSLLGIVSTLVFLTEESRRRMRLFRVSGQEKMIDYNKQAGDQKLARIMLLVEEIQFTRAMLKTAKMGDKKRPGILTKLGLFSPEDDPASPYTAEEREELEANLPRTFFSATNLDAVYENALLQLLPTARSTGINCVLSTQIPSSELMGKVKGNLSAHIMHRMGKSDAGFVRGFGIDSSRPVFPWDIPIGPEFRGVNIVYGNESTITRGVYIPPDLAAEIVAKVPDRTQLNMALCRDNNLFNEISYARWHRVDDFLLQAAVQENTITPEAAQAQMESWYNEVAEGKWEIRALSEGAELSPGMIIDTALRIAVN